MSQDRNTSGAPERRNDYERARRRADDAYEAVGDAEDAIVRAEEVREERRSAGAPDGGESAAVRDAEDAWHERRHEAHAAAEERDRAREQLPDRP
jgi:hypothetical protein